MKQSSLSVWLKTIIIIVALCGLAGLIFVLPALGHSLADSSAMPSAYLPWLVLLWVVALPCYAALVIAWRIADRIGADRSFCRENAKGLRLIAILAAADGAIFFTVSLIYLLMGLCGIGMALAAMLILLLAVAVSVVCAALSHLVLKAALLQDENDLTI